MRRMEMEEEVTVDLTFIRELSGDSNDLLIEIMEIFSNTAPLNVMDMHSRLKQQDFTAVKCIAHKLKSSVNFFGNERLMHLLDDIEHYDFSGNFNVSHIEGLIDRLQRIINKLLLIFEHELMEMRKAS
jgi:hypothetical protein